MANALEAVSLLRELGAWMQDLFMYQDCGIALITDLFNYSVTVVGKTQNSSKFHP